MPRSPGSSPLTPGTVVRGAVAGGVALALGWFSFAGAMTNVAHRRSPDTALRFTPDDAVALAALADRRIAEQGTSATADAETLRLARESLKRQALNPVALRLIGLSASVKGGFAAGRPAMTAANRLTRRDLPTQFWMIEEAVSRGDVAGALGHYDHALRTRPGSQQLLFPVLTAAVEDPTLWPAFARYVREPAPWLGDFARFAVRNSGKPRSIAEFLRQSGGLPREEVYAALEAELLKRLVEAGAFADAARYYRSLDGANPAILADTGFTGATTETRFAPLTWELFNSPGISGAFLRDETGEAIRLHATMEGSATGAVARKIIYAQPGRYRFRAIQRTAAAAEGASVQWELRCGGSRGDNIVWSKSAPLLAEGNTIDDVIAIPAGCGAITLRLLAAAGTSPNGIEAIFGPASFVRLAN
ncbi:MAG TPA: hypothetical protein VLG14_07125 [Sphingomonas sp.]|nr:hypothetical protein [Sphingomonas sp.]